MTWTKRHSKNAVAAKARLLIARAEAEPVPFAGNVFIPRRTKSDFKITIEDRRGHRVQISLVRFGKQFLADDGMKSARMIGRGIELLLRYYKP